MLDLETINSGFDSAKKLVAFADVVKQGIIPEDWFENHLNLFTLTSTNSMFENIDDAEVSSEANKIVWNLVRTFKETYKSFADEEYSEFFVEEFTEKWYDLYIHESLKVVK